MKFFIQIFAVLCHIIIARPLTEKQYQTTVKNIIDYTALHYNLGMQFALKHADYDFEHAAGVQNHKTGAMMKTDDMIPLGSLTKAFTAAALA